MANHMEPLPGPSFLVLLSKFQRDPDHLVLMEFKVEQLSSKILLEKEERKDNFHTVSESQDNFYGGIHIHIWPPLHSWA